MFSNLFKKTPVLDESAINWLHQAYAWCFRHFNRSVFENHTILVIPNDTHFPGSEHHLDGMANLIFTHVQRYAGLTHWPCQVDDATRLTSIETPKIKTIGVLRDDDQANSLQLEEETPVFVIPYNPHQVGNPEALIASYAHILAYYLGTMAKDAPPNGKEYWPQATEVLAIFMGFGLMFANSAYTFRGGCGSCYNPLANRDAALSEHEATYALAMFAVLKKINNQQVLPHLKKYLRGFYKRAVQDVENHHATPALKQQSG